tara:strand:- start:2667 stop:3611 length:945 start_codon:yes stop_codon:yes gene_type:complete
LQYTGNVNRFLWFFLIPILIVFYISFIFWSDNNFVNKPVYEAIKEKQQALKNLDRIDGVILGGSSAWWGISAKFLSSYSDMTWANLAIPAEGYTDKNYEIFLLETLSLRKRQDVSFVVYSASTLVRNDFMKRKRVNTNLYGKNQVTYKPQRSLASYVKDLMGFTGFRPYQVENKYGDFGFANYPCGSFKANPYNPREYLNENDIPLWTSNQLERISFLFPNATVFIYIPNGFNDQILEKNNHRRENLIIKLQDFLFKRESNEEGSVYLLSQKPYQSSDLMCADDWHANDAGRAWRTEELYQLINDQLQFKNSTN